MEALLNAYRGGGLAVIRLEPTRRALDLGQVDELVIAAQPSAVEVGNADAASHQSGASKQERAADELVVKARQTSARIRFVEDSSLLLPLGGVGAFLRFKL